MLNEIEAYLNYLDKFDFVNKPPLPQFDVSAYTDNDYIKLCEYENLQFDSIDDFQLTIDYLTKTN